MSAPIYKLGMPSRSAKANSRLLSEAFDNAKEAAGGFKRTVQDNLILSITLAVAVLALLILCCYLRRRYSTSAQVISKRDHKKLLKSRRERESQLDDRREKDDQHVHLSRERELEKRGRYSLQAEEKRNKLGRSYDHGEYRHANSSMETNQTMTSQEEIEFVGNNGDVETGDQGFEVGVSPIKVNADERHYVRNEEEANFDNEKPGSKKKKSFFARKKKERQHSVGSF
jgi:hypothetical protein